MGIIATSKLGNICPMVEKYKWEYAVSPAKKTESSFVSITQPPHKVLL